MRVNLTATDEEKYSIGSPPVQVGGMCYTTRHCHTCKFPFRVKILPENFDLTQLFAWVCPDCVACDMRDSPCPGCGGDHQRQHCEE